MFQTYHGHFEFHVTAFGLTGALATFQGAMNCTLKPLLRQCGLVFFDDILIYSDTWEHHLKHLEHVLQLLLQDHWQVKLTKCTFAKQEIAYLGHIISKVGVPLIRPKWRQLYPGLHQLTLRSCEVFLGWPVITANSFETSVSLPSPLLLS